MSRRATADEILSKLELFGIRLGLETTHRLLAALDRPERSFASVLVAGTNGKGSTAAFLAAMCSAAGYRTGLFTSPHLESVTERARLDGVAIGEEELADVLAEVVDRSQTTAGAPPTYFEALFVASCLWFTRHAADLVVLEVGMGGRLDATNACEPLVSIVTRVGLEHQEYLGPSIEQIAREKAGVFRAGRPAVIGEPDDAAAAVLRCLATEAGAVPVLVPAVMRVLCRSEEPDWRQRMQIESRRQCYTVETSLAGDFQQLNVMTAIAAAEELSASGWTRLTPQAIEEGAVACRWPGRLERLRLPDGREVVLDAAHNPQAAEALARFLASRLELFTLLFGVLKDKDAESMLTILEPLASSIVLTPVGGVRSRDPLELTAMVTKPVTVTNSPSSALELALTRQRPILVTGSLYLVGEIRALLGRQSAPARVGQP